MTYNTYFASTGREALVAFLHAFKTKNKIVLLPGWVPEGIISPFKLLDWQILTYNVTQFGYPQISDFSNKVTKYKPDLAILIHYFGIMRESEQLNKICRENKTILIEDYAHNYPSEELIEQSVVNGSSILLFSLFKMIGIPDGALLMIRDKNIISKELVFYNSVEHRKYVVYRFLKLLLSTFSNQFYPIGTVISNLIKKLLMLDSKNTYDILMTYFSKPAKMSKISMFLFEHLNEEKLISRRNLNSKLVRCELQINDLYTISKSSKYIEIGVSCYTEDRESITKIFDENNINIQYFDKSWHIIGKNKSNLLLANNHFLIPNNHKIKHGFYKKTIEDFSK